MSTVTVKLPHSKLPEVRHFTYTHNARSWLLLAGYLPVLPSEGDHPTDFINPFLGSTATLTVVR